MMILALLATTAFEDLDALDRDAMNAASALGGQAMPVDRRLRLARCPQGVTITSGEGRALDVRCPTLGWRLRVALVQGSAADSAAPLVRRGDPLTVVSGGAGFRIETSAIATEDGALGRTVRARLDGGTRQISGVVTGAQEISVGRP